jgi:ribosome-associated protein
MYQSLINRNFEPEFNFSTSRSSGPGGQNVNKVNTKVELRFSVNESSILTDLEKIKILNLLKNRINSEGELIIVSQSERSQLKNKENVVDKFYQLIYLALKPIKRRKPSRPTRSSIEKRLQLKKANSQRKAQRGNLFD